MPVEPTDAIFREVKTLAVSRGLTFKALVAESLTTTLKEQAPTTAEPRWKRHIGTLNADAASEIERRLAEIDREAVEIQALEQSEPAGGVRADSRPPAGRRP